MIKKFDVPPDMSLEQGQKWAKEQLVDLTNGVLDDYNKGVHTLDDLKLFFKERKECMDVWEIN
jgi:hypothetical protein